MNHKTHKIVTYAIAIFSMVFTSCENPLEVEIRAKANDKIEAYITKKNWDFTAENGVYHVATSPTYGYEVNYGDTVSFWYVGSTFTSNTIFDTNIEAIALQYHLDTTARHFEPLTVVMGQDNLLEGLHNGLLICRLGQESSIFFNSSYG